MRKMSWWVVRPDPRDMGLFTHGIDGSGRSALFRGPAQEPERALLGRSRIRSCGLTWKSVRVVTLMTWLPTVRVSSRWEPSGSTTPTSAGNAPSPRSWETSIFSARTPTATSSPGR